MDLKEYTEGNTLRVGVLSKCSTSKLLKPKVGREVIEVSDRSLCQKRRKKSYSRLLTVNMIFFSFTVAGENRKGQLGVITVCSLDIIFWVTVEGEK